MADDQRWMYHPDPKVEAGEKNPVAVTEADFESVWKSVGWKLLPKSKEKEVNG
jgi:hypothetical protein